MNVKEYIRQKGEWVASAQHTLKEKFENQVRDISITLEEFNEKKIDLFQIKEFLKSYSGGGATPQASESVENLYKALAENMGNQYHVGEWFLMSQSKINQFAEVTGDKQWIHIDEERAQQNSPFGSTVAHGFYLLSLLPYLTETVNSAEFDYPYVRLVVNSGISNARFQSVVKPNARIRAKSRIVQAHKYKKHLELVKQVEVEIENKSVPAVIADINYRIYCR